MFQECFLVVNFLLNPGDYRALGFIARKVKQHSRQAPSVTSSNKTGLATTPDTVSADSVLTLFAGADAGAANHIHHEYLAVADFVGLGSRYYNP